MGHNAYFVGSTPNTSSPYRSPHALIADTCATCHMELTPPPPLLSYNLAGTNHTFRPSLNICSQCHPVNTSLGPMLQARVKSTLEALKASIEQKIISRNTATPIDSASLSGRGNVDVLYSDGTSTNISVGSIPGLSTTDLRTDDLAKAIWNFHLIEQDQSFGVHNPDFTFAVMGASQLAVDRIPSEPEPIND